VPEREDQLLTPEEFAHLLRLSRLAVSEPEAARLRDDLNAVFRHFRALQNVATEGVPEMTHAVPLQTVLREDEVSPSLPQEAAIALGADTLEGYFRVPRIVE
jgi:aspartyl-tRNA(Asn)/glutamyl-tRNA(Gln) amidotransferase subunit C